jgi:hypothetical protein
MIFNPKAGEIEKNIDLKLFDKAIEKFVDYGPDLSEAEKKIFFEKLKPEQENIVEVITAEVAALEVGNTLASMELTLIALDNLRGSKKVSQIRRSLFGLDFKNFEKIIEQKNNQVLDASTAIFIRTIKEGGLIELSTRSPLVELFEKKPQILEKNCEDLIRNELEGSHKFYLACSAVLPSLSRERLIDTVIGLQINKARGLPGAHEKIVFLENFRSKWSISESKLETKMKLAMPVIVYYQSGEIRNWLSKLLVNEVAVVKDDQIVNQKMTKENVSSSFVSGVQTLPNPEYVSAQRDFYESSRQIQNCENNYVVEKIKNPYAMNFCGFSQIPLNDARNRLNRLSPTISRDVMSSYTYEITKIEVDLSVDVYVFGYSGLSNQFINSKFNIKKSKQFNFVKNLHPSDNSARRLDISKDDDVRDFVQAGIFNPSSSLIFSQFAQSKSTVSTDEILAGLKSNEKSQLEKVFQQRVDSASPPKPGIVSEKTFELNEILAQSIVLIRTRDSIGTGFFVKNKFILSNQHVVGSQTVVQIEFKDGRKTSGIVMHADAAFDLALIAVPIEGKPVELSQSAPSAGEEAHAMGHPQGLSFSLSKGIVSAVREINSLDGFSLPLKYVQTDVAINPGNSGGPLIVNGKAVGINTFKRADRGSEGLGFALLSTHVIDWLNRHAPR